MCAKNQPLSTKQNPNNKANMNNDYFKLLIFERKKDPDFYMSVSAKLFFSLSTHTFTLQSHPILPHLPQHAPPN